MATGTLLSEAEFDVLQNADEEKRYELLDGELIEMGSPRPRHQRISRRLCRSLEDYLSALNRGEVIPEIEFALGGGRRLIPDLAVFLGEKSTLVDDDESVIRVIPDLVVEIISPSEFAAQVDRKIAAYIEAGVGETLVVYPATQHVLGCRSEGVRDVRGSASLTSELLPGWSLPLEELFRTP